MLAVLGGNYNGMVYRPYHHHDYCIIAIIIINIIIIITIIIIIIIIVIMIFDIKVVAPLAAVCCVAAAATAAVVAAVVVFISVPRLLHQLEPRTIIEKLEYTSGKLEHKLTNTPTKINMNHFQSKTKQTST